MSIKKTIKNGLQKICRSLWDEHFCFQQFFLYLLWFGRKMEFCIFKKPFPTDKTINVDQNWLVNDFDIQYLIIRECTKYYSNRLILSQVIVYTDRLQADRQTQSQKPSFLTQGSQNGEIWWKTKGSNFDNTFSDENVKMFQFYIQAWFFFVNEKRGSNKSFCIL